MAKKTKGLNAGKRIMKHRVQDRKANKKFKSALYGLKQKADPLKGSPQAKAIILEKLQVEAKQPNSAMRKCVRVQLIKNGKQVTAFCPGDGASKLMNEHDEVIVECIGGKMGRAKGDLPGVRWKVLKVNNQSLKALLTGKIERARK
jgi:small subunit ribosomal protein S12